MAIVNLHLDLEENYKNFLKDLYKIFVVLIVIQIILTNIDLNKDFLQKALFGEILNDEILILLLVIIISISAYYLIFNKLLEIN